MLLAETGDAVRATNALSSTIEGCHGLQFAFIDKAGNLSQAACSHLDAKNTERLARHYSTPETNQVIASMSNLRNGRFTSIEDFVDMKTFRETEFYHEMLRPREPNRVAMMSVVGAAGAMSFGLDQDPHAPLPNHSSILWAVRQFGRAMRQHILVSRPDQRSILLDFGGNGLGASRTEIGKASLGALTSKGTGAVVPASAKMRSEFERARRLALNGTAAHLVLPGDTGPCRVSLLPGPSAGRHHFVWVMANPLVAPEWSSNSLTAAFGLTPREASVVLEMLAGSSIEDTARHLGLSARSVRTYLSAVYAKVECDGQNGLLRKLLG